MPEWLERAVEQLVESATCSETLDPVEIIDEIEHMLIDNTGFNLNGKPVL
jgi:hypothetical protein